MVKRSESNFGTHMGNIKVSAHGDFDIRIVKMFAGIRKRDYRPMLEFIGMAITTKGDQVEHLNGEYAWFGFGNATHFGEECPFF